MTWKLRERALWVLVCRLRIELVQLSNLDWKLEFAGKEGSEIDSVVEELGFRVGELVYGQVSLVSCSILFCVLTSGCSVSIMHRTQCEG